MIVNTLSAALLAAEDFERDPLSWFSPTLPQDGWLRDGSRNKLLRGPNQAGKTAAQAFETIHRMLGTHPYLRTHEPPIECWNVNSSWKQSLIIQRKFWEMIPKDRLAPGQKFTRKNGFPGQTFELDNGSLCTFVTAKQDTVDLASATLHYIGVDEPPPAHIWGELLSRVRNTRGTIGLTLTPIGRPIGWLRKLCEKGAITDHHYRLTPANCTPIGWALPFLTQDQINEYVGGLLGNELRQRAYGEWEGATLDRVFRAFDDHMIGPCAPDGMLHIGVGIDHGSDAGSQVAILMFINREYRLRPQIWIVDEYVSDGMTTTEQDAWGILAMLGRNGVKVANVDRWIGDRHHGGTAAGGSKSNKLLQKAIADQMGMNPDSLNLPLKISTAHKGRQERWPGAKLLHGAMIRGDFTISPVCTALIKSLRHWKGKDDDLKHAVDALRYGAYPLMTANLTPQSPVSLR